MTRGLNFIPSEKQREELSYFANSLWDIRAGANVVVNASSNPLVASRNDFFGYTSALKAFDLDGGTVIDWPMNSFYEHQRTAAQYFDAIYQYRVKNYPKF